MLQPKFRNSAICRFKRLMPLTAVALLILFTNCNSGTDKQQADAAMEKGLPSFIMNPESENPDLYFRMLDITETDSSYTCLLKSIHKNDTLGMELEVLKWIEPGLSTDGTANEELGFSTGKMRFKSLGKISDNVVAAIADQYKMPTKAGMTNKSIEPMVFSSNKERLTFANNQIYSFKLFMKNSIGEEAEVFAIIDLHRRLFELKARDVSQFSRIIDAWQQ